MALTADPGDRADHAVQMEPRRLEVPEALGEHDVERQQEPEGNGHLWARTDDSLDAATAAHCSATHGRRCAVTVAGAVRLTDAGPYRSCFSDHGRHMITSWSPLLGAGTCRHRRRRQMLPRLGTRRVISESAAEGGTPTNEGSPTAARCQITASTHQVAVHPGVVDAAGFPAGITGDGHRVLEQRSQRPRPALVHRVKQNSRDLPTQ